MLSHWIGGRGTKYADFVWRAVTNTHVFSTFRREKIYRRVVGGVRADRGRQYLEKISDATVRQICFESEYADTIGGPQLVMFEGKKLSPTTFRYGKVLSDLVGYFPKFHTFRSVVEIGIGYGGQARLIAEYCRKTGSEIQKYTMVDLLPVTCLARLYLEHFVIKPYCEYCTKSTIGRADNWDLVISNYAFSEFSRDLQEEYIELVLKRSSSGYLTMNTGLQNSESRWGGPCLKAEELVKTLPNAVIRREEPLTSAGNYIIIYGEHEVKGNYAL